jgi:acyl-coenzyme A thioesterase PaaI-like protein
MKQKAIQEYYPDELNHCYGCGQLNEHGLKIKSFWNGEEAVALFDPEPYHTAFPGYVYGGLIASIIDCHSIGTAAAAAYQAEGREMGSDPAFRYVTASLHVEYLKPTPIDLPLEVRGKVEEINDRKVLVRTTVSVNGELCAKAQVIAVKMPERLKPKGKSV